MRMRVLTTKLRVEIENEMRVFLESLNFEIEMRVSQKSALLLITKLAGYQHLKNSIAMVLFQARDVPAW